MRTVTRTATKLFSHTIGNMVTATGAGLVTCVGLVTVTVVVSWGGEASTALGTCLHAVSPWSCGGVDAKCCEGKSSSQEPVAVPLWPDQAPNGDGSFESSAAKMTVHLPKNPGGSVVIICPGGGYGGLVTGGEGHGIARWLNGHGIAGIVLEYRLPAGRSFVPLLDAQRAIRMVRANAEAWRINPRQVGIMGFSAGGHLASTAATHFDEGDPAAKDPLDRPSCRPDFAVLVYPVVTMGERTHVGSKTNLLGADPTPEMIILFSNEKQVSEKTPPMFLAHAVDDEPVPSINSEQLFAALQSAKIPAKYLELPSGGHGLNGYQGPMWEAWQKQSLEWLVEQELIKVRVQDN